MDRIKVSGTFDRLDSYHNHNLLLNMIAIIILMTIMSSILGYLYFKSINEKSIAINDLNLLKKENNLIKIGIIITFYYEKIFNIVFIGFK